MLFLLLASVHAADEMHTFAVDTWRVPGPEGSTAAIGVYFEGATPLWSEE